MILQIKIGQDIDLALFPLIEHVATYYLPVDKLPATRYYHGYILAAKLGMTPEKLLKLAFNSKQIHAVCFDSGVFYLHPTGINKYLSRRYKKLLAKQMSVTYN